MFHPEVSCSLYVAAVAVVQAVWDAQEVVAVQNIRILHLHKAHCFPPSGTFFHNSNLYSHEIRTKLDLNIREEYSIDYKLMNSNHFYHKVVGVLGQIMDVFCILFFCISFFVADGGISVLNTKTETTWM